MDSDQKTCLNIVSSGHNLLLLGQAGTGKTYTIKECVRHLRDNGKNVALTCYTGIACLQYKLLNPMTLHKFAGLEDGRHQNDTLLNLLKTDERYSDTKSRIMNTDVLVVDEISMVSRKIFETVEYLCRKLREDVCFGGIQLLLSGDFYQLAPIKDELYGDNGDYCFQSLYFQQLLPHIVHLTTVHRQSENKLIQCINELEKGITTPETDSFMHYLSRPFNPEVQSKAIKLFARNIDVDIYNYQILQTVDNPLYIFEAQDTGDPHYLNKLLAPKRLGIKDDSPVMLLRNINDRFVNGLIGRVLYIEPECVKVAFKFNGDPEVLDVVRYTFTKYDPVNKKCIASRHQFPLRLAYAMTIHKSQGMSLPLVEIDCKHANNPGQIGVAVGRAESVKGLRVLNYKSSLCRKHPNKVEAFYLKLGGIGDVKDNLDCCKFEFNQIPQSIFSESDNPESEKEELDNLVTHLENIDTDTDENNNEVAECKKFAELDHNYADSPTTCTETGERVKIEHDYALGSGLKDPGMISDFGAALDDFIDTPQELIARNTTETIMRNEAVTDWYARQHNTINKLYENTCSADAGNVKPKDFTEFYSSFNRYILSEEYHHHSLPLLGIPFAQQILTSVMLAIQRNILKNKADTMISEYPCCHIFPPKDMVLSAAGRGKIRYIGGYCVAKCRYHLCSALRNSLYIPEKEPDINIMNQQINMLDSMTTSHTDIFLTTVYENTLEETARKQNTCEGLTNITDSVFEFFETLESLTRNLMTHETLLKENKYMYRYVLNEVLTNESIKEKFKEKCIILGDESCSSEKKADRAFIQIMDESIVSPVFERIVRLFVTVTISQFRKDYLRVIKREKGKALRKKVLEKKAQKSSDCPNISFIQKDKSDDKDVSHLKLKAIAIQNDTFYQDFKKAELIQLLKAYGKNASMRCNKKQLGETLLNTLKDEKCMKMSFPQSLNNESTEPSQLDMETCKTSTSDPKPSTSDQTTNTDADFSTTDLVTKINSDNVSSNPSISTMENKRTKQREPKRKARQSKGKSKRLKKCKNAAHSESTEDSCGICSKTYKDGQEWICCDTCSTWYHRDCVGLQDDDWVYFSSPEAVFVCPLCR